MITKKTLIVTFMVFALCVSMILGVFAACNMPKDKDQENNTINNDSMLLGEKESKNIKLASVAIPQEQYSDYGIATVAETAKQITATIVPTFATNKAVDWFIVWTNPSSSWANGKTVTDYVTLQPVSNGSLTANVSCLKPFGEQVTITVKSRENAEIKASCTADYAKRITAITFTAADVEFPSTGYTVNFEYSPYTIDTEVTFSIPNQMYLTQAFADAVGNQFAKVTTKYRYNTDWWFGSSLSGFISTDYNTKKISFTASTKNFANVFTAPDDEYSSTEIREINSYVNEAFRQTVNSFTGVHATLTITYSATRNGTTYSSGTKTIDLRFDKNSIRIPVAGLTLSNNLLF